MKDKRPLTRRWRCLECGAEGIGGRDGWTAHWLTHHNEPPF